MNEEEIIKNIKEQIQWSDYTKERMALQGLLDLYKAEKEKNEELEEKIKKERYEYLKLDIKIREIKQVFKEIMEE